MSTLMLDSSFGGAGSTLPPITCERTPDSDGHESVWQFWEEEMAKTEAVLHDDWTFNNLGSHVLRLEGPLADVIPIPLAELIPKIPFPPRAS